MIFRRNNLFFILVVVFCILQWIAPLTPEIVSLNHHIQQSGLNDDSHHLFNSSITPLKGGHLSSESPHKAPIKRKVQDDPSEENRSGSTKTGGNFFYGSTFWTTTTEEDDPNVASNCTAIKSDPYLKKFYEYHGCGHENIPVPMISAFFMPDRNNYLLYYSKTHKGFANLCSWANDYTTNKEIGNCFDFFCPRSLNKTSTVLRRLYGVNGFKYGDNKDLLSSDKTRHGFMHNFCMYCSQNKYLYEFRKQMIEGNSTHNMKTRCPYFISPTEDVYKNQCNDPSLDQYHSISVIKKNRSLYDRKQVQFGNGNTWDKLNRLYESSKEYFLDLVGLNSNTAKSLTHGDINVNVAKRKHFYKNETHNHSVHRYTYDLDLGLFQGFPFMFYVGMNLTKNPYICFCPGMKKYGFKCDSITLILIPFNSISPVMELIVIIVLLPVLVFALIIPFCIALVYNFIKKLTKGLKWKNIGSAVMICIQPKSLCLLFLLISILIAISNLITELFQSESTFDFHIFKDSKKIATLSDEMYTSGLLRMVSALCINACFGILLTIWCGIVDKTVRLFKKQYKIPFKFVNLIQLLLCYRCRNKRIYFMNHFFLNRIFMFILYCILGIVFAIIFVIKHFIKKNLLQIVYYMTINILSIIYSIGFFVYGMRMLFLLRKQSSIKRKRFKFTTFMVIADIIFLFLIAYVFAQSFVLLLGWDTFTVVYYLFEDFIYVIITSSMYLVLMFIMFDRKQLKSLTDSIRRLCCCCCTKNSKKLEVEEKIEQMDYLEEQIDTNIGLFKSSYYCSFTNEWEDEEKDENNAEEEVYEDQYEFSQYVSDDESQNPTSSPAVPKSRETLDSLIKEDFLKSYEENREHKVLDSEKPDSHYVDSV